jgi:hypothetical protein
MRRSLILERAKGDMVANKNEENRSEATDTNRLALQIATSIEGARNPQIRG